MEELIEVFDPESAGVMVEGLTVTQIKRLKHYYTHMTKDFDLNFLEDRTKGV